MMSEYKLSAKVAFTGAFVLLASWESARANPYECLIEPNQTVEIRSSTEGVIEKIFVKRGGRVKAGQTLVQLESSVEASSVELARYRSNVSGRLASAESRLEYAGQKLQRLQELQAKNFVAAQARDEADAEKRITEAEFIEAKENLEVAKLEHRQAVSILNRRTLRSPFDGVVMERMQNPGDLAESGTGRKPILKLAQVEPLRVEVVLPIEAYGKLTLKSAAEVTPEVIGGKYSATVSVIDGVFDSASGTFGVRLALPNKSSALPAGIRCQVSFPSLDNIKPRKAGAGQN
jgi:RND family efflux transporter MFP subunit